MSLASVGPNGPPSARLGSSSVSFFPIDETLHHILDQYATTQKDFFENVYGDPMINGCMIAVYIFGFLGCAGLILV